MASEAGSGSGSKPDADQPLKTQIITPKAESTGPVMVPCLQVVDGPRVGSLFRFNPTEENTVTIGRTSDSQFVLAHPTLSRTHAKFTWIRVGPDYHLLVEDLNSTNGTAVNGNRIDSAFLNDGDRINVGDVMLKFQMLSCSELAERDRLVAKATRSETDPLTGLGTRHYMSEVVPKLFSECEARAIPISLLIMDLDHFKQVNDTFGHQAGDEVLKAASRIVTTQIRASDVAIRFGGEEMLVFLPGSNVGGARLVAERVRCAISAFDASAISPTLRISVSIGVAQRLPTESLEELTRRADESLYKAKHGGRNRVVADLTVAPPAPAAAPPQQGG
jgi:diguanylate cyclase (GGDEF)-like protein